MDITTITDIDKAKSLAFDEIAKIETAQNNLRLLQARIQELNSQKDKDDGND